MNVNRAMNIGRAHQQRMDNGVGRGSEARLEIMPAVFVHQKSNRAAMHPVDRLSRPHVPLQCLQHQPIAAERNQHIGVRGIAIAIGLHQLCQRLLGFWTCARDKSDPAIGLG